MRGVQARVLPVWSASILGWELAGLEALADSVHRHSCWIWSALMKFDRSRVYSRVVGLGIFAKLWRKARGVIQRYGSSGVKRRLWDAEFSSGRWSGLENMEGDCLYPTLEKYSQGKTILDLGCGPGATAAEIRGYGSYTGVDISAVAIAKAQARNPLCDFAASDIESYCPQRQYDVIVFADSLYYVASIPEVLHRYCAYLSPSGVFIARIKGVRPEWFTGIGFREHGQWARRYAIISAIQQRCTILEYQLFRYTDVIAVVAAAPQR